MKQID
jgi:hypothetical protein